MAVVSVLLSSSLLLAQQQQAEGAEAKAMHSTSISEPTRHPAVRSRPFTSSPLYPHPARPDVSIATADSLDEIVGGRGSRNQHVLVEVYSPYCHACERLTPVLDQVAHILSMLSREQRYLPSSSSSPPSSFLVAVMDDSKNHAPGFLTPDEERYLPVLKFFPAPASASSPLPDPVTYHGPHNAAAILSFIASALPASSRPSASVLNSLTRSTSEEAFRRVKAVFKRQRDEQVARDPTLLLFDHAPCGSQMQRMMESMILSSYTSEADDDEEKAEVLRDFQQCVRGKREETDAYWKTVRDIAQAQLDMGQDSSKGGAGADDSAEDEAEDEQPQAGTQHSGEARGKEKQGKSAADQKATKEDTKAAVQHNG